MDQVFISTEHHMKKSIQALVSEYSSIRAGRANPSILDKVQVDYYGTATAISQLASISVAEARTLIIQPWDASICKLIEKAIQTSDLGINPQNDGKIIRITFPPLTEERRKEIVKEIAKLAEDAKVAIRSIRREAIDQLKKLKKNAEITEDDLKQSEKQIQELTNRYCKEADDLSEKKEKEIMVI